MHSTERKLHGQAQEKEKIFVVGHQRPDTDAAVSAAVCAALKQRLDASKTYVPLIQGDLNPQARWLFEKAGIPQPQLRLDIRPTVGEAMVNIPITISPDMTLEQAVCILRDERISMLPVVDSEGTLLGIMSDRVPESQYLYHLNVEHAFGDLITVQTLKKAFNLQHICGPEQPAVEGDLRVASHDPKRLGKIIKRGDSILMSDSQELFTVALDCHASVVVLAECSLERAQEMVGCRCCGDVAVFHYPGSLLTLVADLPMAIAVERIMVQPAFKLRPEDPLDECRNALSSTSYALPVLDGFDRVVGVLSAKNAVNFPPPKVILVDHFEKAQTIGGIHMAEIIEIIDHHRIGNIETAHPLRVDCRPVGSTATVLACQFKEAGLEPTPEEALLLLGALVSDTLLLTSPTTTDVDRAVATRLATLADVELDAFGRDVLRLNDELATGEPADLVEKDLKEFTHGNIRFAVAQLETVDLSLLTDQRRQELALALEEARRRLRVEFAVLMVTDVFKSISHVILADPNAERARKILEGGDPLAGKLFPGMVSRKKQAIPWLFSHL